MDNFVHSRFLHYLTIDIEGYEYIILESLIGTGKFAKENITFCQIDAELHNPKMDTLNPAAKGINSVDWVMEFIRKPSPYVPIFNVPYVYWPHQKITFINVQEPECEKAFQFTRYFYK